MMATVRGNRETFVTRRLLLMKLSPAGLLLRAFIPEIELTKLSPILRCFADASLLRNIFVDARKSSLMTWAEARFSPPKRSNNVISVITKLRIGYNVRHAKSHDWLLFIFIAARKEGIRTQIPGTLISTISIPIINFRMLRF